MRRTAVLSLAGLLVLAIAAAGYWYLALARPLQPHPAPRALLAAEDALALPGLFILGHFDAAYAVRAERTIFGPDDADPLPAPFSDDNALVRNLHAAGLRPRDSLHHVLYGFGALGGELGSVAILLGSFPADPVVAAIGQSFEVDREIVGRETVLHITIIDPDTCGTRTLFAHVADDRVILADRVEFLSTVVQRLPDAAPAEQDLADWRSIRNGSVASIGVIVPPMEAVEAATQGSIVGAVAANVEDDVLPVRQAYAGLRLSSMPPAISLDGWVEGQEQTWPLEVEAGLQSWRLELVDMFGEDIPTLLDIYDRLELAADERRLRFTIDFDEDMAREMRNAFAEAVDLVLSGMGFSSGYRMPLTEEPEEETIPADQVPEIPVGLTHDRLSPFAGDEHGPAWQAGTGPFGLRIKSLRVNAEDSDVVDIELEAVSSEIPEIHLYSARQGNGVTAELVVTGVLDRNGRNLLRVEPCGEDRNALATALERRTRSRLVNDTWVPTPILSGTKTVRLEQGARVEDVASLNGHVRLTLPTGIASHRLDMPAAGEVFETEALRLRFREGDPGELAYIVSGDRSRLMEVRALNDSGDYLAKDSTGIRISFSHESGLLSDLGSRREEKAFRGEPAAIELLIAEDYDVRDYPFTIESVDPPRPEWNFFGPDTEPRWAEAMSRSTFDRLMSSELEGEICQQADPGRRVGPFRLCVGYLQLWRDEFHGGMGLRAPIDEWFESSPSAFEILIDSITVQQSDGAPTRDVATDRLRNRVYFSDLRQFGDPNLQAWEQMSGMLASADDLGDATPVGIQGRIVLRMPKALADPLPLDIRTLGSEAATGNGVRMRVTGFEYGYSTSVTVDFQGPRIDLLEVVQSGADGTVLGTASPKFESGEQPDRWTLTLEVSDRTSTLGFVLATEHHSRTYPFALMSPD